MARSTAERKAPPRTQTADPVSAWVAQAKAKWAEEAKRAKEAPEYRRHPDGRYRALLTSAKFEFSQNSNRPQLVSGWTVTEGELEGEILRNYDGLDNEQSLYYLARWMARFGRDPEEVDLENLQDVLDEIVGEKHEGIVRLKTKGEYQNLFVEKVMDADDDDDADADADDSDESGDEDDSNADASEAEDEEEEESEEGDEDDEDEAVVEVGMKVNYPWRGEQCQGEVTDILEDEGKVKVRTLVDGKGKIRTVSVEELTLAEDGDTEEEEVEEKKPEPESKPRSRRK